MKEHLFGVMSVKRRKMMKREKIMSWNFYCLFVILPEWVCADMREVTDIRINLSQMNNKIFEMRWHNAGYYL